MQRIINVTGCAILNIIPETDNALADLVPDISSVSLIAASTYNLIIQRP